MGFRAILNFRKFKVALNRMHRIFLTLQKSASHPAYQNSMIRNIYFSHSLAIFLPFASVWKRKGNGCYAGYLTH